MPREWTMLRVGRDTIARLEAVRASMLIGVELGVRELQFDDRDRVSLDQVVNLLIDARERHAARRKRSAARRRRKAADVQDAAARGIISTHS